MCSLRTIFLLSMFQIQICKVKKLQCILFINSGLNQLVSMVNFSLLSSSFPCAMTFGLPVLCWETPTSYLHSIKVVIYNYWLPATELIMFHELCFCCLMSFPLAPKIRRKKRKRKRRGLRSLQLHRNFIIISIHIIIF